MMVFLTSILITEMPFTKTVKGIFLFLDVQCRQVGKPQINSQSTQTIAVQWKAIFGDKFE